MRQAVNLGLLVDSVDAKGMCVKEIRVGNNVSRLCPFKMKGGSTVKGKISRRYCSVPKRYLARSVQFLTCLMDGAGGRRQEENTTLSMRLSGCLRG